MDPVWPPLLSITVWCSLSVTYWSLFTLDNKITPPSPTRRSNLNTRNGACLVITLLILRGRSLYPWRKYLSWFTMTMTTFSMTLYISIPPTKFKPAALWAKILMSLLSARIDKISAWNYTQCWNNNLSWPLTCGTRFVTMQREGSWILHWHEHY